MELQKVKEAFDKAEALRKDDPEKGLQLILPAWEAYVQSGLTNDALQVKIPRLLFSLLIKSGGDGLERTIALADKYLLYKQVQANELLNAEMVYLKSKALRYGGQFRPALTLAKQAYEVFAKYNFEKGNYMEVVSGLAYNYLLLGEYESAFNYNRQHFELAVKHDDKDQQAIAMYYLSVVYGRMGNMHEAVIATVQNIRFVKKHNTHGGFGTSCTDLAICLDKLGKKKLAEPFFIKAIKELVAAKDEHNLVWSVLQYFMVLNRQNRKEDLIAAIEQYDDVLHRNSYGNYRYLIANYRMLASILQHKIEQAQAYLPVLLEALEHTMQPYERGGILGVLATYYDAVGNYKQAYEYSTKLVTNNMAEYDDEHQSRLRSLHIRQNLADAKRQKEQADELARLKQQFLANMSHEIRSPMNAIIGLSGLLSEEDMTPRQKEIAGVIKRSSENLVSLINDVLDNAKIEAGKFTIESVPFSLPDLLNDVVALLKHKADEKGIELLLDCPEGLHPCVCGDPTRLRQVLVNLLNNAVKFTPRGSVFLKVEEQANGASEKITLHFTVHDTGIGIAKEKLSSIFTGYMQASDGTARTYGGTGLGLKISKELIQLMGGTLTVQSSEGSGSTFSFSLPFTISQPPVSDTLPQEFVYTGAQTFSFLIADDLEDNRYVFSMLLKHIFPNSAVTLANDGLQAVNSATANNYDLIVMDIDMPLMNGIEAAMKILAGKPQQKILGSSANVILEAADLKEYGFEGFIPKPFTKKQFAETLRELLAGRL